MTITGFLDYIIFILLISEINKTNLVRLGIGLWLGFFIIIEFVEHPRKAKVHKNKGRKHSQKQTSTCYKPQPKADPGLAFIYLLSWITATTTSFYGSLMMAFVQCSHGWSLQGCICSQILEHTSPGLLPIKTDPGTWFHLYHLCSPHYQCLCPGWSGGTER